MGTISYAKEFIIGSCWRSWIIILNLPMERISQVEYGGIDREIKDKYKIRSSRCISLFNKIQ